MIEVVVEDILGNTLQINKSYTAYKQEEIGSVDFLVGDSQLKYQDMEFKQRKTNLKVLVVPVSQCKRLPTKVKKTTSSWST